uniref:Uncharacterized protein n=1 Tax=Opuntia streptacantha TaxID=393608 RepID=A0A7C9DWQ7_OPUST
MSCQTLFPRGPCSGFSVRSGFSCNSPCSILEHHRESSRVQFDPTTMIPSHLLPLVHKQLQESPPLDSSQVSLSGFGLGIGSPSWRLSSSLSLSIAHLFLRPRFSEFSCYCSREGGTSPLDHVLG